jgi:hypothetical protein
MSVVLTVGYYGPRRAAQGEEGPKEGLEGQKQQEEAAISLQENLRTNMSRKN